MDVAVPEAEFERTDEGLVPKSNGWYVLNARDAVWQDRGPRGVVCDLEGDANFEQLGFNIFVLHPGSQMSMYHWEADQEDFLVLSGEAILIVENEERPLRAWDFFHKPPNVSHTMIGAGDGPCVVVAVGARANQSGEGWGAYPYSELAMKYDASTPEETNNAKIAYGRFPARKPSAYQDGWLPGN
jgi:uncharacterized cupin superfamily protein